MAAAYSRPTCGFFDPSMKNGGPDLYEELNPRMKQRKPVNMKTNRAKRSSLDIQQKLIVDSEVRGTTPPS